MTHDAFEHIARELRPKLLHIGVRFFGNNATAEDIAEADEQETSGLTKDDALKPLEITEDEDESTDSDW